MIEDKKTGTLVAENPEEELWYKVVQSREETIKQLNQSLQIENVWLESAKKKLEEVQKSLKKSKK